MSAVDSLSEAQARQLVMDLDAAFGEFRSFLQRESGGSGGGAGAGM